MERDTIEKLLKLRSDYEQERIKLFNKREALIQRKKKFIVRLLKV